MAFYTIPPEAFPGFELISELSDAKAKLFGKLLSFTDSTEKGFTELMEKLVKEAKVPYKDFESITKSLFSMTNIYWDSRDSPEKFSTDFTQSFLRHNQDAKNLDLVKFQKNISVLVSSMGPKMKSALKAREILSANQNNFAQARIISDIRIVYDDDESLDKKEQQAVIVHSLRIRYNSVNKEEIFIALDLSDLKHLQRVINRAIEKDKLMRTNAHKLTFLDPK